MPQLASHAAVDNIVSDAAAVEVAAAAAATASKAPPHPYNQHHPPPPSIPSCIKSILHIPHLPRKGITLALALYVLVAFLLTFGISIFPFWRFSCCKSHDHSIPDMSSQIFQFYAGLANADNPSLSINSNHGSMVSSTTTTEPTDLRHIVFCIASTAKAWGSRQEYVKLWWKPLPGGIERRGFVWLDKPLSATARASTNNTVLPDVQISSNAAQFPYRVKGGNPSAVRISRIVSETFRLGLKDVRWFVMGDDDTIFFPENLATVLRKYDHGKLYYIGQSTESQRQAVIHSFGMAYGGGGIAISYALAEAIEKMQDDCLHRYPNVYGSDGRIGACAAELGVPLTREPGFHQIDLHHNIYGLLAAHPVAPLVSLHHIDQIQPIFPDRDRLQALRHLFDGALPDQEGLLQQSICFDTHRRLTFSVSWGYVVQIFDGILTAQEAQKPIATFRDWAGTRLAQGRNELFTFDVRSIPKDRCQIPAVFFMESVRQAAGGAQSYGVYRRKAGFKPSNCPRLIEHDIVEVFKQPQSESWATAPRRQCCEVMQEKLLFKKPHATLIKVRDCMRNEIIAPRS